MSGIEGRFFFMRGYQAVLLFIGLSLDSFVVMMNKAATLRNLTFRKSLLFSLIFSLMNAVAVLCGYGLSSIFMRMKNDRVEMAVACLIVFAIGIFLTTRSYRLKDIEEKCDPDFGYRECFRLAAGTSIDTLFLATSFSFLDISLSAGLCYAFLVTFVTILVALYVGYSLGSRYSRTLGMSGGALMIILSIYLMSVYVLR